MVRSRRTLTNSTCLQNNRTKMTVMMKRGEYFFCYVKKWEKREYKYTTRCPHEQTCLFKKKSKQRVCSKNKGWTRNRPDGGARPSLVYILSLPQKWGAPRSPNPCERLNYLNSSPFLFLFDMGQHFSFNYGFCGIQVPTTC